MSESTHSGGRQHRPHVAVCFTGFVRNGGLLDRNITEIFGPSAVYDAFVESPNERYELDHTQMVDGQALCRSLRRQDFRRCAHHLFKYDSSFFFNATSGRCLYESGKYQLGLYPSRTASLMHGYTRCVRSIQASEHGLKSRYDWIVLTRLDTLRTITPKDFLSPPNQMFWPTLERYDVVANRGALPRVEDRLVVGRRDAILQLFAPVYDAFRRAPAAEAQYAELFLHFYLKENLRGLKLGPIDAYIDWNDRCEHDVGCSKWNKYSACFLRRLVDELHLTDAQLVAMVDRHAHDNNLFRCHRLVSLLAVNHTECHTYDRPKGMPDMDELHPRTRVT